MTGDLRTFDELKDELDVLKGENERLKKAERDLEKLKRRASNAQLLEIQLKEAEEKNVVYQEKLQKAEKDLADAALVRSQLKFYESSVKTLDEENKRLHSEVQTTQDQIEELKKQNKAKAAKAAGTLSMADSLGSRRDPFAEVMDEEELSSASIGSSSRHA